MFTAQYLKKTKTKKNTMNSCINDGFIVTCTIALTSNFLDLSERDKNCVFARVCLPSAVVDVQLHVVGFSL